MKSLKNDEYFTLTTLIGFRYEVTFKQILSWFLSWKYLGFLVLANLGLIFLAPHNKIYGLDLLNSIIFWPIITTQYTIMYIFIVWLGRLYATSKENRRVYTPLGILFSSVIGTYSGAFLVAFLTGSEPDLSMYKTMEIFFNVLLACLFEAVFYIYFIKRLNKSTKDEVQHEWENF